MFIQLFSCFKRYQALKKGKIFRFEALDHFLEKQESVEECVFTGVFSLPGRKRARLKFKEKF